MIERPFCVRTCDVDVDIRYLFAAFVRAASGVFDAGHERHRRVHNVIVAGSY